jgi:hypothetical protein
MSTATRASPVHLRWPKWYIVPGVLLAFVTGVAVGNGHTTYHAVTEAKQDTWGDCTWTLKRELRLQRHKLQP